MPRQWGNVFSGNFSGRMCSFQSTRMGPELFFSFLLDQRTVFETEMQIKYTCNLWSWLCEIANYERINAKHMKNIYGMKNAKLNYWKKNNYVANEWIIISIIILATSYSPGDREMHNICIFLIYKSKSFN